MRKNYQRRFEIENLECRRLLSAAPVQIVAGQGLEVQTGFQTPDGILVNLGISASKQITIVNGKATVSPFVSVTLEEFDTVNFVDDMLAQGFTSAPGTATFDLSLKSGTIKASVPMTDQVNNFSFFLNINLKFKPNGTVTTTRSLTRDPGTGAVDLFTSQSRDMIASGMVTSRTVDTVGLNSYFDPSQFEEATASQSLEITLTPPNPSTTSLFSKVKISDPTADLLASTMGVLT